MSRRLPCLILLSSVAAYAVCTGGLASYDNVRLFAGATLACCVFLLDLPRLR